MAKERKNRNASELGQRLLKAMRAKNYEPQTFANDLALKIDGAKSESILETLSKMINGKQDKWPAKWFLAMEELLDVKVIDLINHPTHKPFSKPGLFEVGTYGKYNDFERLDETKDSGPSVLDSYDEWDKKIYFYVYESKNFDGVKYLFDSGRYNDILINPAMCGLHGTTTEEEFSTILEIIENKGKEGENIFLKLFDNKNNLYFKQRDCELFKLETIIKIMLASDYFLEIICEEKSFEKESFLNPTRRESKKEFLCLCSSVWLTPLLCYSLNHEDEYKTQANRLLDASLQIAKEQYEYIKLNQKDLSTTGLPSITTKNGLVILDHNHVIGVIGEAIDVDVKDKYLREKVEVLTSKIGLIRQMSQMHSTFINNGLLHATRPSDNPTFKHFLKAAEGKKYLLHISKEKNPDKAHNEVFEAPKGRRLETIPTEKQWKELGKALKYIHSIDCGEEGKSFCLGQLNLKEIFVLENGEIECIADYSKVYIGDPKDDVMATSLLALNYRTHKKEEQNDLFAFLEGYGYQKNDFFNELFDYLIDSAKKKTFKESRRFLEEAMYLLPFIKEVDWPY